VCGRQIELAVIQLLPERVFKIASAISADNRIEKVEGVLEDVGTSGEKLLPKGHSNAFPQREAPARTVLTDAQMRKTGANE
jgi:hypothetical protein